MKLLAVDCGWLRRMSARYHHIGQLHPNKAGGPFMGNRIFRHLCLCLCGQLVEHITQVVTTIGLRSATSCDLNASGCKEGRKQPLCIRLFNGKKYVLEL